MAKHNVAITQLLPWDEYRVLNIDTALKSIYDHAGATAKARCNWYWTSIKIKSASSVLVRSLTFLLLFVGTCAPLLAGMQPEVQNRLDLTQWGVAALAAAGLLQLADRVFGWSSGWLRYISTVTAMENLTRKFELDWAQYIVTSNNALALADAKLLFDMAARLEGDIAKLQSEETDKWVSEFNSGTAALGDIIKSQRESTERSVDAARTEFNTRLAAMQAKDLANLPGSINLTLSFAEQLRPVSISIDGVLVKDNFSGTQWSQGELAPGQYQVTVRTIGAAPHEASKTAEVPSGGICALAIAMP